MLSPLLSSVCTYWDIVSVVGSSLYFPFACSSNVLGSKSRKTMILLTFLILHCLMSQIPTDARVLPIHKRSSFYVANETACVVDGRIYYNGENIPTDNPCESCRCRPPGFSCVLHECEIKHGCKAIRREGECCPEYLCGCEHNGQLYRNGEEIKDPQNPCYRCHCQGNSIVCAFLDCIFRRDCPPKYVAGECCPYYSHCRPSTATTFKVSTALPDWNTSTIINTLSTSKITTIAIDEITSVPITTAIKEDETSISDTIAILKTTSAVNDTYSDGPQTTLLETTTTASQKETVIVDDTNREKEEELDLGAKKQADDKGHSEVAETFTQTNSPGYTINEDVVSDIDIQDTTDDKDSFGAVSTEKVGVDLSNKKEEEDDDIHDTSTETVSSDEESFVETTPTSNVVQFRETTIAGQTKIPEARATQPSAEILTPTAEDTEEETEEESTEEEEDDEISDERREDTESPEEEDDDDEEEASTEEEDTEEVSSEEEDSTTIQDQLNRPDSSSFSGLSGGSTSSSSFPSSNFEAGSSSDNAPSSSSEAELESDDSPVNSESFDHLSPTSSEINLPSNLPSDTHEDSSQLPYSEISATTYEYATHRDGSIAVDDSSTISPKGSTSYHTNTDQTATLVEGNPELSTHLSIVETTAGRSDSETEALTLTPAELTKNIDERIDTTRKEDDLFSELTTPFYVPQEATGQTGDSLSHQSTPKIIEADSEPVSTATTVLYGELDKETLETVKEEQKIVTIADESPSSLGTTRTVTTESFPETTDTNVLENETTETIEKAEPIAMKEESQNATAVTMPYEVSNETVTAGEQSSHTMISTTKTDTTVVNHEVTTLLTLKGNPEEDNDAITTPSTNTVAQTLTPSPSMEESTHETDSSIEKQTPDQHFDEKQNDTTSDDKTTVQGQNIEIENHTYSTEPPRISEQEAAHQHLSESTVEMEIPFDDSQSEQELLSTTLSSEDGFQRQTIIQGESNKLSNTEIDATRDIQLTTEMSPAQDTNMETTVTTTSPGDYTETITHPRTTKDVVGETVGSTIPEDEAGKTVKIELSTSTESIAETTTLLISAPSITEGAEKHEETKTEDASPLNATGSHILAFHNVQSSSDSNSTDDGKLQNTTSESSDTTEARDSLDSASTSDHTDLHEGTTLSPTSEETTTVGNTASNLSDNENITKDASGALNELTEKVIHTVLESIESTKGFTTIAGELRNTEDSLKAIVTEGGITDVTIDSSLGETSAKATPHSRETTTTHLDDTTTKGYSDRQTDSIAELTTHSARTTTDSSETRTQEGIFTVESSTITESSIAHTTSSTEAETKSTTEESKGIIERLIVETSR